VNKQIQRWREIYKERNNLELNNTRTLELWTNIINNFR
jgi:hypothetical protein